jgi:type II secretory pathway pseudopilin PulG
MRPLPHIARSGRPTSRQGRQIARPGWSGYVTSARFDSSNSAGFTILEIILSLAILAGCLATLGEIMRLANQNSAFARDETTAELLATSLMEELLAGTREFVITNKQPFEYVMEDPWVYSIIQEQTTSQDVIRVGVRVELNIESRLEPPHYEVYRWMLSPQYLTQVTQNEERIAQEAAAQAQMSEQRMANQTSTTTSGSGGSSTGTGGGTSTGGGG